MLANKYLNFLKSIKDYYSDFDYNFFDSIEELVEIYNYSKADIARMVYFGNIKNWCDDYFYIDDCENISSINDYEFCKMLDEDALAILDEYENYCCRISDADYKYIKEIRKLKRMEELRSA